MAEDGRRRRSSKKNYADEEKSKENGLHSDEKRRRRMFCDDGDFSCWKDEDRLWWRWWLKNLTGAGRHSRYGNYSEKPKGYKLRGIAHTHYFVSRKRRRGMRLYVCTHILKRKRERERKILRSWKIYRLFVLFHVRHLSRATPRSLLSTFILKHVA